MWGSLLSSLLRWMVFGMLFSVTVLVGSAVLRRAAATQSAAASGMSGMAAAPSLPGPGSSAGYAPKEYIKVPTCTWDFLHLPDACPVQLDRAPFRIHNSCHQLRSSLAFRHVSP